MSWALRQRYADFGRFLLSGCLKALVRIADMGNGGNHHAKLDQLIGSCAAHLNSGGPKSKLARQRLGRQLNADPIALKLVLLDVEDSDAVEVYERVDDSPVGAMARSWLADRRPPSAELAGLVVDQLAAGAGDDGRASFAKAIRSVQYVANSFGLDQVHVVAGILMEQVGVPINPYAPNPLVEDCRSALVTLLIERPEVQDDIGDLLQQHPASAQIPALVELAAAGISGRAADWGRSFIRLITAWQPSNQANLIKVAEMASAQSPLTAERELDSNEGGLIDSLRHTGVITVAVAMGPVLAIATGVGVHHFKWTAPQPAISVGEAIAVLAVIATVNIFSVQLSADRLPGPLARVAAQPFWLNVSYSAALTLVVLTLFSPHSQKWQVAADWSHVTLAVFSIATLVIGLLLIASRTDPARAAAAYVASSLGTHRRTGRSFGRIQASAAELRAYVDRVLWIEMALGPQTVGRRSPISAIRRGALLPTRRSLDRLGQSKPIQSGEIRLRVHEGFGNPLDRGTEFASLRPNETSSISRGEVEKFRQALRIVGIRRLDQSVAAGSALISLALDLALSGDTGSAHLVGDRAALLIGDHIGAVRRARRRRFDQVADDDQEERNVLRPDIDATIRRNRQRDNELAPVSPVLNVAVRLVVSNRLHVGREVGDIPEYILRALLNSTTLADGGCAIASSLLPRMWEEISATPEQIGSLAELIAIRAMELNDRNSLVMIRTAIGALIRQESSRATLQDSASLIAANSCWLLPTEALRFTEWFIGLVQAHIEQPTTALLLLRMGGAALASGRLQVAVTIASRLVAIDLSDPRLSVTNDAVRSRETILSNLGGRYLGDTPADTLANFAQFATDIQTFPTATANPD